jgi:hypothetical protein
MADANAMLDKVNAALDKPARGIQGVVNFFMRDGTIAALGREAIKDVQDTYHEVAFGQSDHMREPGSPLTPLFSDIAAARDSYAPEQPLPSPSQIGREGKAAVTVHGQDRQDEKSQMPTPSQIGKDREEKSWQQHVQEPRDNAENSGNDQNERGRSQSLPEEQREQEKGRGR